MLPIYWVWPESPQVNLLYTKYTYTHLGLRYISVHHTHPNIKHVLHRGCVVPNRQHFAHCICTQNYGRATYYYHHDMYVRMYRLGPLPSFDFSKKNGYRDICTFFLSIHIAKNILRVYDKFGKIELSKHKIQKFRYSQHQRIKYNSKIR